jgi:hypothetical protein
LLEAEGLSLTGLEKMAYNGKAGIDTTGEKLLLPQIIISGSRK